MSKKLFALALVAVLCLAFAGTAFAGWGDSTYITSSQIVNGTTGSSNPHGPYDDTSRKCAACHAVHNATPGGAQLLKGVGSGGDDACMICHIDSTGYSNVYNGDRAKYTTASQAAHDSASGVSCKSCHTIHGVGAAGMAVGENTNLKAVSFSGTASRPVGTFGALSVSTLTGTNHTLSEWCSGCHPYLAKGFNQVSHVMTDTVAAYGNTSAGAPGAEPGSVEDTRVAWAVSTDCDSCHQSNTASGTNPRGTTAFFPHYTEGARFLLSGDNSSASFPTPANQTSYDGACLVCHTNGTLGVGKSF